MDDKEGGGFRELPPYTCTGRKALHKDVLMIFPFLFPSRRLLRRGGIFLGPDRRRALGVKAVGSGVMDLSPLFLTAIQGRYFSAATAARNANVC